MTWQNDRFADTQKVANWYANLKQACPFLHKGQCIIYDQRPIACIEHFIKGSSRACKLGRGRAEVVHVPVSMVEVLGELTSRLEDIAVEAVMLPLALAWSHENAERSKRFWPAEIMAECFVEIIEQMALHDLQLAVCSETAGS